MANFRGKLSLQGKDCYEEPDYKYTYEVGGCWNTCYGVTSESWLGIYRTSEHWLI